MVLVRSPCGILSPRSIAYNRPKHGKRPSNQESKQLGPRRRIETKNYSNMRQEVRASAIRPLAGGRAEGASPARSRSPSFTGSSESETIKGDLTILVENLESRMQWKLQILNKKTK